MLIEYGVLVQVLADFQFMLFTLMIIECHELSVVLKSSNMIKEKLFSLLLFLNSQRI